MLGDDRRAMSDRGAGWKVGPSRSVNDDPLRPDLGPRASQWGSDRAPPFQRGSIDRAVRAARPGNQPGQDPAVWAIDESHAPLYWFPRDCPRGTLLARHPFERGLLIDLFTTSAERQHVTEHGWLDSMRNTRLFTYHLPRATFEPRTEAEGQWVSAEPVEPLSVEPVGEPGARHVDAGVEIRLTNDFWPFWDRVVESGLPFSGVRLRNASPRVESDTR